MRNLWVLLLVALSGCSGEPDTGPGDVRWDRETCARCAMALSDRHYAAQVRVKADGKNQLFKFDDIGCALLWLDDKPFKDAPQTEIWVADHQSGAWLDARTASYVKGKVTPMGYGLGAQKDKVADALDFAAAWRHIREVEAKINLHGGAGTHQHSEGGQ